jgi:hypothetical protein
MNNDINNLFGNLGINLNGQEIKLSDILKIDIGALNNLNMLNKFEKNNNINNSNNNFNKEELDELIIKTNELIENAKNIVNKINNSQ